MTGAKSVAIIGGGLIGAAGAVALGRAGCDVTVVTRAPAALNAERVRWTYGDLRSAAAAEAVAVSDTVIYAAGTVGPATRLQTVHGAITDEIVPVVRLAETAAQHGSRTFVFISSGGTVYGAADELPTPEDSPTAPLNIYGRIKVLSEQALMEVGRRYGLSVVVLRVANPYGPGQSGVRGLGFVAAAIKAAVTQEPLVIWGDGSTTRDFIYIDDVGDALSAAAHHEGGSVILNIGSGAERSLIEVCDLLSKRTRRPLAVQFDPGRGFDVPRSWLDISRAADVIGWRPRVSLETGIDRTLGKAFHEARLSSGPPMDA